MVELNILICDDIPHETDKLSGLLDNLGYNPMVFTKSADVLAHIRAGAAMDVCILDIIMPEMGGIELARNLREIGFNGEIVFLSASNEYGPQTYEMKACNYLIKPTSLDKVKHVLNEIEAEHEMADTEGIKLKISGSVRFVLFRNIEYVEVIKHNVVFNLADVNVIEVRSTFTDIAPLLLCDNRFIQCHQSYIVNMDIISSITSREIIMRSGARIPVAKSYPETKMKYLTRGLRDWRK